MTSTSSCRAFTSFSISMPFMPGSRTSSSINSTGSFLSTGSAASALATASTR